jgi:hypothetical protein
MPWICNVSNCDIKYFGREKKLFRTIFRGYILFHAKISKDKNAKGANIFLGLVHILIGSPKSQKLIAKSISSDKNLPLPWA